jgi:type IV secretion system protein VirB5
LPETDSYKVRWVERETGIVSGSTIRTSWEAILALRIDPPETEADILANPLGVKITDINWSQIHTVEE